MWQIIKDFFPELKRHPWWGALFVLAALMFVILLFAVPLVFGRAVDVFVESSVFGDVQLRKLLVLSLIWFGLDMFSTVAYQVKDFAFSTLMNFHYNDYVVDSFRTLMRKDVSVFSKYKSGYLVDLFDRGVEARWAINYRFVNRLAPSILSFFVIVIGSFFVSWQLALTLLVVIPFQVFIGFAGYRATKSLSTKTHKAWSKTYGVFGDVITNVYATKSYAAEQYELRRVKSFFKKAMDTQFLSNRMWMWFGMIDVRTLSMFSVMVVGSFLVFQGSITVGTVMMFFMLGRYIVDPVRQIFQELQQTQRDMAKHDLLKKVLIDDEVIISTPGSYAKKCDVGHYVLDNVSFFHNDRETLKNISLEIKKGEKIALVGPSGAGKSTLAFLLARFYDPKKGKILLDGVDLREWDYDVLRKHIAVVWQENMLFHETLKYNITYGKRGASDREIRSALKDAQIDRLLKRQKKGLRAMVGERGIRLSGGEKQRVMIARAMLKNPDIVILDEATSALDSLTERDVQKSIERLITDKTAVVIAHRLSTIKHVDRIYVMDAGRIVAQGTHEQLVNNNELYRKMVHVQSDGMIG